MFSFDDKNGARYPPIAPKGDLGLRKRPKVSPTAFMADLVEPHATTSLWRPAGADASEDRVATLDRVLAVGGVQPATEEEVAASNTRTMQKAVTVQIVQPRTDPRPIIFVNGTQRDVTDSQLVLKWEDFQCHHKDTVSGHHVYSPLAITYLVEDGALSTPKCRVEARQQLVTYGVAAESQSYYSASVDLKTHTPADFTAPVIFAPFPAVVSAGPTVSIMDKSEEYAYEWRNTKKIAFKNMSEINVALRASFEALNRAFPAGLVLQTLYGDLANLWNNAPIFYALGALALSLTISTFSNDLVKALAAQAKTIGAKLADPTSSIDWKSEVFNGFFEVGKFLSTWDNKPKGKKLVMTIREFAQGIASLATVVQLRKGVAKETFRQGKMYTQRVLFTWLLTSDGGRVRTFVETIFKRGGYLTSNRIDVSELDAERLQTNSGISHVTRVALQSLTDDELGCSQLTETEFDIVSDLSESASAIGAASANLLYDLQELQSAIAKLKKAIDTVLKNPDGILMLGFQERSIGYLYDFLSVALERDRSAYRDARNAIDTSVQSHLKTVQANLKSKLDDVFVADGSPGDILIKKLQESLKTDKCQPAESVPEITSSADVPSIADTKSLSVWRRSLPQRLAPAAFLFPSGEGTNWTLAGITDVETADYVVRENAKLKDAARLNSLSMRTQRMALSNLYDEWEADGAKRIGLVQFFGMAPTVASSLKEITPSVDELESSIDTTSLIAIGVVGSVPLDLVAHVTSARLLELDRLRKKLVQRITRPTLLTNLGFGSSAESQIAVKLLGALWTQELIGLYNSDDSRSVMSSALGQAAERLRQCASMLRKYALRVAPEDAALRATRAGRDVHMALMLFFGGETGPEDEKRLEAASTAMLLAASVASRALSSNQALQRMAALPFEPLQSLFGSPCAAINAHRRVRAAVRAMELPSDSTSQAIVAATAASYGASQLLVAGRDEICIAESGDFLAPQNIPCRRRSCGESKAQVQSELRHRLAHIRLDVPLLEDVRTPRADGGIEDLVEAFAGLGAEDAQSRLFYVPAGFGSLFSDANDTMFGSVPVFADDLMASVDAITQGIVPGFASDDARQPNFTLYPLYPACEFVTLTPFCIEAKNGLVSFVASMAREKVAKNARVDTKVMLDCHTAARSFLRYNGTSEAVFEAVSSIVWNAERVAQSLHIAIASDNATGPDVVVLMQLLEAGVDRSDIEIPKDLDAELVRATDLAFQNLRSLVAMHARALLDGPLNEQIGLDPDLEEAAAKNDERTRLRAEIEATNAVNETTVGIAEAEDWVSQAATRQELALQGYEFWTLDGSYDKLDFEAMQNAIFEQSGVRLRDFPSELEELLQTYSALTNEEDEKRTEYRNKEKKRRDDYQLRARASMLGGLILGGAIVRGAVGPHDLVPSWVIGVGDTKTRSLLKKQLKRIRSAFLEVEPGAVRLAEAAAIIAAGVDLV